MALICRELSGVGMGRLTMVGVSSLAMAVKFRQHSADGRVLPCLVHRLQKSGRVLTDNQSVVKQFVRAPQHMPFGATQRGISRPTYLGHITRRKDLPHMAPRTPRTSGKKPFPLVPGVLEGTIFFPFTINNTDIVQYYNNIVFYEQVSGGP